MIIPAFVTTHLWIVDDDADDEDAPLPGVLHGRSRPLGTVPNPSVRHDEQKLVGNGTVARRPVVTGEEAGRGFDHLIK